MNKVVKSNSIAKEESTAQVHRDAIVIKIDTYSVVSESASVVEKRISIDVKFVIDSDGTDFNIWLQDYISTNSTDFESANVNIHDCKHDTNEPCENLIDWNL